MEADGLDNAPKIIATQEDRVMVGPGDAAYVTGIKERALQLAGLPPGSSRSSTPRTAQILGYEAFFLGNARVVREGEPATVEIVSAKQEIATGDRLIPVSNPKSSPTCRMRRTRVVDRTPRRHLLRRRTWARQGAATSSPSTAASATISKSAMCWRIYRHGRDVDLRPARSAGRRSIYKLPEERYGLVFVFRVFDRVSYALVVDAEPVRGARTTSSARHRKRVRRRAAPHWLQADPDPGSRGRNPADAAAGIRSSRGRIFSCLARRTGARRPDRQSPTRLAPTDAEAAVDRRASPGPTSPATRSSRLGRSATIRANCCETPDPPTLLYAKGRVELLNRPALAVVGSRNATPQGVANAEAFAASVSRAGLTVVSGLALGIDAAAHRGGLSGPRLDGGGHRHRRRPRLSGAQPRSRAAHRRCDGVIVSEFPLGTPAAGRQFSAPQPASSPGSRAACWWSKRRERSGSLITARLAAEQGRDVFAIPGSIHSPLSKGCHRLIKRRRETGGRCRATSWTNWA
ncbi:MAG: DNA-protecting protein DprA [Comamonadaceae bacterium]|nr:DNA-protecting protein DprA [Comamonadaceae bacterium]